MHTPSPSHFSGVIFDFNGTLLWDSELHHQAWHTFFVRHHISSSTLETEEKIQGKSNEQILLACFGKHLPHDDIQTLGTEKELIYQNLYLAHPLTLAPGAIELFNDLKTLHIPFTIATSSPKVNVDFYFEHLNLSQWFEYSGIFYDNGHIPNKPNPEIFELAITHIKQLPASVLIFEDSEPGIHAAHAAQVGKVIVVTSSQKKKNPYHDQTITHFNQVDRELFTLPSHT